jgi:hypothetical protein
MFRPAIEDHAILLLDRTFLTIHFGALLVIVGLTISARSCRPSRKHLGCALAVALNFFPAGTALLKRARAPDEIPNSPMKAQSRITFSQGNTAMPWRHHHEPPYYAYPTCMSVADIFRLTLPGRLTIVRAQLAVYCRA